MREPRGARQMECSLDHGLLNGVSIPLRDVNPLSRAGMGIMGDPYEDADTFARFLTDKLPTLRIMAEAFHLNLQRSQLQGPDQQLSIRERECLLWSSYGLQSIQIADRLGTHRKTVEKQLQSARNKLKARSTTQAVVKAMLLGQIEP